MFKNSARATLVAILSIIALYIISAELYFSYDYESVADRRYRILIITSKRLVLDVNKFRNKSGNIIEDYQYGKFTRITLKDGTTVWASPYVGGIKHYIVMIPAAKEDDGTYVIGRLEGNERFISVGIQELKSIIKSGEYRSVSDWSDDSRRLGFRTNDYVIVEIMKQIGTVINLDQ